MADKSKKLWSSRFSESNSELLERFNASISFDYKLYKYDIEGSRVHAKMLEKQGIIDAGELDQILKGLDQVDQELDNIDKNQLAKEYSSEDIHMYIEEKLTQLIGNSAKKLHTARSRNDQVATDLRLWLKDQASLLYQALAKLRTVLIDKAEEDIDILIPGYTHLQQAQAISLGHFWLAHESRFSRDSDRLADSLKRIDVNPLGSGALAGTTFNIDREYTTTELGFSKPSTNSLDAVSDRDFVAEYEFVLSMIAIHLSQLSEELITWNSQEFGYLEISDAYATGSSMMPQKKNPDIPELVRGKTGRVIAALNALMITLKSLPLAYNKDLQEDKEMLFMSNDTVLDSLEIYTEFLNNISIDKEKTYEACLKSFSAATDIAEYLVKKGEAFRSAYGIVGEIVKYAIDNAKNLNELSLEDYKKFHKDFESDILDLIKPESCVDARDVFGGTARSRIKKAIESAKTLIQLG